MAPVERPASLLEAIPAIAAVVVFIAIVQRGRRLREKEEAGPSFGELLNRQDVLILDTETTGKAQRWSRPPLWIHYRRHAAQ